MRVTLAKTATFRPAGRRLWPWAAILAFCVWLGACQGQPTPPPTTSAPLPGPVSAGAVAVDPTGARLAAVNPDSGSVTLVDLATLTVQAEVPTGADPRTLSFTPDGERLLVANHGAGTLSVI